LIDGGAYIDKNGSLLSLLRASTATIISLSGRSMQKNRSRMDLPSVQVHLLTRLFLRRRASWPGLKTQAIPEEWIFHTSETAMVIGLTHPRRKRTVPSRRSAEMPLEDMTTPDDAELHHESRGRNNCCPFIVVGGL
jgi:hypothetical protein